MVNPQQAVKNEDEKNQTLLVHNSLVQNADTTIRSIDNDNTVSLEQRRDSLVELRWLLDVLIHVIEKDIELAKGE